jgi:hypothetical protein
MGGGSGGAFQRAVKRLDDDGRLPEGTVGGGGCVRLAALGP